MELVRKHLVAKLLVHTKKALDLVLVKSIYGSIPQPR